ncbi:MAG: outer membrane protein assembly factor BamA [Phycisphaeraceae bacterium]|nr:outer membrane protein assembly factor BamA [Phycisphaeraceae bacterium]
MSTIRCQLACLGVALLAATAFAAGVDLADRPVAEVRVRGLDQVPEQLVRNQIRMVAGKPYDAQTVEQDIVRITHLGRFASVRAEVLPRQDGSLQLTYHVQEQPLLSDVQVVGNKALPDAQLLGLTALRAGDPIDPFLIERAVEAIKGAYEDKGFFVTDVTVDDELLEESQILLLRVREGPKVRIKQIEFDGNEAFTSKQLRSKIKSRTHFILLRKGELSREQLSSDAARVRDFYRRRGYLDAEVGRRIRLSPDQDDAVVTFLVREGPRYTVESIEIEGNELFADRQIIQAMSLRPGDVFSLDKLETSQEAVANLYGKIGFVNAHAQISRLFHEDEPRVDLVVDITEGEPYLVGRITTRGNELTQDKVVLREVRGIQPGRRFDRVGVERSEQRLRESSLFNDAKITLLQPHTGPGNKSVRDVLIEVEEANTGSISFGAGVSSDAGIVGAIDMNQRNFDIADFPESPGEFFSGKAFRGAGQRFAITLQPGDERNLYQVSFSEPYLLESDIFLSTRLFYFTREREDWDEERAGGTLALGRRLGDVWTGRLQFRGEQIEIRDIDDEAPVDVFAVEGDSLLTEVGLLISRNTTNSRFFPTRGSLFEVGLSRTGAFGGDFDYTTATAEFRKFWTVDKDFFGRETVLSLRAELGYIIDEDEAPTFERFFAGGHRSFRGFKFRGVGPRGIRNDTGNVGSDPVGGDWMMLLGLEYNFPIYKDFVRGVVFADTGTVEDDLGLNDYRVSLGTGVRLKLPFFGSAPFALDIAVPIVKEETDEERLFSFDLALPF